MKNESVKESLEGWKNFLEEKRKMVEQQICKKDQHVYKHSMQIQEI